MAVSVRHSSTVATPDDGSSEVGSDEWNAAHVVTGAAELLTADRTYYVRTTGNNSNDGLSSGAAFLTLQRAADVAVGLSSGGNNGRYIITVDIGAGTFGGFVYVAGPFGIPLRFRGAGIANTFIDTGGFYVTNGLVYWGEFTITTKGYPAFKVDHYGNAAIEFGTTVKVVGNGSFPGSDFVGVSDSDSHLTIAGALQIEGAFNNGFWATNNAFLQFAEAGSITLNSTPSFSTAHGSDVERQFPGFMRIEKNSYCRGTPTFTITGSATGKRFVGRYGGVIKSLTGSLTDYPGDAAGTLMGGSSYDDVFGVGTISYGTHSAIGAETVTGFITITDAGGTTRKVAVVST